LRRIISVKQYLVVVLRVGLGGAFEAAVEVVSGELGGDRSHLKDELVSIRADPGDRPPAEEGLDADAVEPGDAAIIEVSGESVIEVGEVAPRGQHDAAAGDKVYGAKSP
jgi:hypothetical protein